MDNKFNNTTAKSCAELKQAIREQFSDLRHHLTATEIQEKSIIIANKIIQQPFFATSKTIAAYYPYPTEVNPLPILEAALAQNKTCYLPRIASYKNRELEFFIYNSKDKLEKNSLGIYEPKRDLANILNLDKLDLLIVPCLAFDSNNYRIGFGAGFYDILISKIKTKNINKNIKIIGVAFAEQKVDKLPVESFDMQLDAVVTDN